MTRPFECRLLKSIDTLDLSGCVVCLSSVHVELAAAMDFL
jgi:hypothetical protein